MKRLFRMLHLHDNNREIELQGRWLVAALVAILLAVIYTPDGGVSLGAFLGIITLYASRMFYSKYSLSAGLRISFRDRVKCIYFFTGICWLLLALLYIILGSFAEIENVAGLIFDAVFIICLSFMLLPLVFIKNTLRWWCCWGLEMVAAIGYHHGMYTLVSGQGTRNVIVIVTFVLIVVLGWLWSNRLVRDGLMERKAALQEGS